MAKTYKDFDEWKLACDALKLNGPVRLPGFQRFAYTDKAGNEVAHWHSEKDEGFIDEGIVVESDPDFVRYPNPSAGFQESPSQIPWSEPIPADPRAINRSEPAPAGNVDLVPADPQAATTPKEVNFVNSLGAQQAPPPSDVNLPETQVPTTPETPHG